MEEFIFRLFNLFSLNAQSLGILFFAFHSKQIFIQTSRTRYCNINSCPQTSSSSKPGAPGLVGPRRGAKTERGLSGGNWTSARFWHTLVPSAGWKGRERPWHLFQALFCQRGWSWCSGIGDQGGRAALFSPIRSLPWHRCSASALQLPAPSQCLPVCQNSHKITECRKGHNS